MARVTVRIPGLLTRFTDGEARVAVDAESVAGAVEALVEAVPELEHHLYDGTGTPRAHLRLFHEGEPVEWSAAAEVGLADGDTVAVVQAVSGGSGGTG